MNKKIVIIENQLTQFEKIRNKLAYCEDTYNIYPDIDSYKEFLDWIRIYLDTRYEEKRRLNFFRKIVNKIKEENPDLLIIDHILVGCHSGKTGIDLALKLRTEGKIATPILFLSRSDLNTPHISSQYPKIAEPREWVSKNSKKKENLEDAYFNDHIMDIIKKLLKKERTPIKDRIINQLRDKSTNIPDDSDMENIINKLTKQFIDYLNNNSIVANEKLESYISHIVTYENREYRDELKKILSTNTVE